MPIEAALPARPAPRWTLSPSRLRNGVLWLLVASGSFVLVEPAPYEALVLVTLLAFGLHLRLDRAFAPLVALIVLFDIGGLLSLIPWTDDHDSVTFAITSIYVSFTAILFACVVADRSQERLDLMRRAYIVAGVFGGIAGILGYFDVAGLGEMLTKYDRASGTFKDPNVLGPFLDLPIVWIAQQMLLGELPRGRTERLWNGTALLIMAFALFLTFSRGAWGVCIASLAMMVALTFVRARSARLRRRIIVFTALGFVAVAALIAFALTIPAIRDVFVQRASLSQDYDLGETGRFGNQWRSLPMLLEAPNGFGPLQFRHLFAEEDPHNVYVNAFASYGWLGGFAYCTLVVMTMYVGFWLVFRRTPFQAHAIALWSCLFIQLLQGFQIDTDHWRHLFLMLGCVWGLAAAARRARTEHQMARRPAAPLPPPAREERPAPAPYFRTST